MKNSILYSTLIATSIFFGFIVARIIDQLDSPQTPTE
jgi:hypothetical protein